MFLPGKEPGRNAGIFPVLFLLLVLPHFSFRFRAKEEKVLPQPYWVEAQNRDAFQVWQYSRPASEVNFVFAPLQDTRQRALLQNSMIFKVPALPKEEEFPALNELKKSLLENRDHQMKIDYEELLLRNSAVKTETDYKKAAEQYRVKIKKSKFSKKNSEAFKKKLMDQFNVCKDFSLKPFDEKAETAGWGGFSLKGQWRDGFDRSSTREEAFGRAEDGLRVLVMMKAGYYGYFEDDAFQALDLRYGDGKVSLLVFLPHPEVSLDTFYQDLNFEKWSRWMDSFIERQGSVRLPKFKVATLSEECCQLTVFETCEKGGKDSFRYDMTEVLGTEEQFEFNAVRPFFFAVRDNETDLILLMGQFTGRSSSQEPAKTLPA